MVYLFLCQETLTEKKPTKIWKGLLVWTEPKFRVNFACSEIQQMVELNRCWVKSLDAACSKTFISHILPLLNVKASLSGILVVGKPRLSQYPVPRDELNILGFGSTQVWQGSQVWILNLNPTETNMNRILEISNGHVNRKAIVKQRARVSWTVVWVTCTKAKTIFKNYHLAGRGPFQVA